MKTLRRIKALRRIHDHWVLGARVLALGEELGIPGWLVVEAAAHVKGVSIETSAIELHPH